MCGREGAVREEGVQSQGRGWGHVGMGARGHGGTGARGAMGLVMAGRGAPRVQGTHPHAPIPPIGLAMVYFGMD